MKTRGRWEKKLEVVKRLYSGEKKLVTPDKGLVELNFVGRASGGFCQRSMSPGGQTPPFLPPSSPIYLIVYHPTD
jgi:hypothetical protein